MALDLGKNLPIASSAGLGSKISKTPSLYSSSSDNLKKNNAKTSVFSNKSEAVISVSRLNNALSAPTSSISRVNNNDSRPTTSVNRMAVAQVEAEDVYSQEADDRRYNYVRRLIKARQEKAVEKVVKEGGSAYDFSVHTGKGFRLHGRHGLMRKIYKMKKENPLAYKHWGDTEKKYLADMLKKHVEGVSRGTSIGYAMRRRMKYQIDQDRKSHKINIYAAKDMKKIVDELPG
ncbi:MAG TPA: hypothetical protein DEB09_02765 [Candidatus Magasanikbacteria bacterium]|nr:hypothetical protein [Candidatus Magasanikbacteria bacterium]